MVIARWGLPAAQWPAELFDRYREATCDWPADRRQAVKSAIGRWFAYLDTNGLNLTNPPSRLLCIKWMSSTRSRILLSSAVKELENLGHGWSALKFEVPWHLEMLRAYKRELSQSDNGASSKVKMVRRIGLPIKDWPAADRDLWEMAQHGRTDTYDLDAGACADWSHHRRSAVVSAFGLYLTFAAKHQSAAVERHLVNRWIADLTNNDLSPVTIASYAERLLAAARIMRTGDWSWLEAEVKRLKQVAKHAPRRRPIAPITATEILLLGKTLCEEARSNSFRSPSVAIKFRNGLILTILAHRPIRCANLAALRIGEHLKFENDHIRLELGGHETKNGREFTVNLDALQPLIEEYLMDYRPILGCRCDDDQIWPTWQGGPLSAGQITRMITTITDARLGIRVTTHDVRHIFAYWLSSRAQDGARAATAMLGHSDPATTELYRKHGDGLLAQAHCDALLAEIEAGAD